MTASPPSSSIIRAEKLTRRFRSTWRSHVALHDVDLSIDAGECVLLMGQNGAGKSTLLRLLAGLDRASSGALSVFGSPVHAGVVRDRTAYLSDDSELLDYLSVRETLIAAAALRGMTGDNRRAAVRSMAGTFGLESALDRRVVDLSLGMRRRTAIGACLVGRPSLWLFDEPTNGLDADGARAFRRVLAAAKAEGVTIVIAGHDIDHVAAVCDRVVVLKAGRVRHSLAWTEFCSRAHSVDVTIEGLDAARLAALGRAAETAGGHWSSLRPSPSGIDSLWNDANEP